MVGGGTVVVVVPAVVEVAALGPVVAGGAVVPGAAVVPAAGPAMVVVAPESPSVPAAHAPRRAPPITTVTSPIDPRRIPASLYR